MTEAQEIKQALQDPKKFEVLYNRYFDNVFRFCYQRSKDYDMAGDLTSQVFLKAMKKLKQYQDRNKGFASWLISIAFNEINDFYRRSKKERTVRMDLNQLGFLSVDKSDENVDLNLELGQALNRLQSNDLNLIELKYFEGRSHEEISEILNISAGNARIRLHRALDKVKRIMLETKKLNHDKK